MKSKGWQIALSIGSPAALMAVVVLLNFAAGDRQAGVQTLRSFGDSLLMWPLLLVGSAIVGPIIAFPAWFLHDLLRRSRQPGFPRKRAVRLVAVCFVLFLPGLVMWTLVGPVLLVLATVYLRLKHPRSPWPRILRGQGPNWLGELVGAAFLAYVVANLLKAPPLLQGLAALAAASLDMWWKLRREARAHVGHDLELPDRCILHLRPFGFDDQSFFETKPSLLSLFRTQHAVPFDAFLHAPVESQLGRFVSFGDPGDISGRWGAKRFYLSDSRWQAVFEKLVPRTRAFFAVVASVGENFLWELARLRKGQHHTRLFLFTSPPAQRPARRRLIAIYERLAHLLVPSAPQPEGEAAWRRAALALGSIGYQLPADPGPGAVIGFSADGTARILAQGCREPEQFIAPVARALEARAELGQVNQASAP